MNALRFILAMLIGLILLAGCDGSNPSGGGNSGNGETTPQINWVGIEVLFNETPGKKSLSLIYFEQDGCGWCANMEATTLADQTVRDLIDQSFNAARLNPSADSSVVHFDSTATCQQMKTYYGIWGYPTTVFLDRDGNLIETVIGYYAPVHYITILNRIISEN
jgi:thioredoxin-related protein